MKLSVDINPRSKGIAIEDKMTVAVNGDPIADCDKLWVLNHGSFQMEQIKYPTFENEIIDEQLSNDISFDELMKDLKLVHDIFPIYFDGFTKLILSEKNNILKNFRIQKLKFINFHISLFFLYRQLELLSFLLTFKYESQNVKDGKNLEIVREKFGHHNNVNYVIELWMPNQSDRKMIFAEIEKLTELEKIFDKNLKNEDFLLNSFFDNKGPTVCVCGVIVKFIKCIMERSIVVVEFLKGTIDKDVVLELFQDSVKFQILSIAIKGSFRIDKNDIFNLSETSEEWVKLKKNFQRKVI